MKKIIAIFALFLFITACGTQKADEAATTDSTIIVKDTVVKVDTAKVDTTVKK